ncbi:methyltransferase domain-containing protein [Kitasatospora sp. NPDC101801]|uniref:methyltransferase domain-containing protein n=1 Tax=Kitasatospora sp. NPDC101801 TaxID=3364103 RepID=UPI00381A3EA4
MVSVVPGEAQASLDAQMERAGAWPERSPWLRAAVAAVPREGFAPTVLYRWDGRAYRPVDGTADRRGWADLVYGDPNAAAVTQVTAGLPSSSLSCQAVVVDMLDSALLEPGHRVLELGTGTGWNAALTTERVGPGRVVSIEWDDAIAAAARRRLTAAQVEVRVGDGTAGAPDAAPFDRVIATYAVDRVPWAWVAQCRPGGRIVTPWGRLGHVALTVAADHRSATGWMQGLAKFMASRAEPAHTESDFEEIRAGARPAAEPELLPVVEPLRTDWHLLFALRVALPDVRIGTAPDGVTVRLHDNRDSWATVTPDGTLSQGGPRRLGRELTAARTAWEQHGRPGVYDYGMTVTPDTQYVWATDPETGPRWPSS